MKGDPGIIQQLNQALAKEIISINQTFLHARMLRNWGIEGLGRCEFDKSIKDMKQADRLIERVLFLEGLPNLQNLGRLRMGEDTAEILDCELALTEDAIETLRAGVAACESVGDYVSRALLDGILDEEEDWLDWLTAQRELVDKMGLPNYIQMHSRGDDDEG